MGDDSHKRKGGPGGDRGNHKKSKGGVGNRWQTPNQKARQAAQIESGTKLGVGDSGIWVTYARGQRPRAVREFIDLCEEYGQLMYGIKPFHADDAKDTDSDSGPVSIEASIEKELSDLQEKKKRPQDRTFTSVNTGIECVFFLKTRKPVDPLELTRRMCADARSGDVPNGRRCKYVNRLVPVVDVDKATEGGMERVGREVLGREFALKKEGEDANEGEKKDEVGCTYAIRHNIRHNKEIRRQQVIDKVASLVDQTQHKVNLGQPDKVILVEVFQMLCGMSVVDGTEWEGFKRYNLNEMYKLAREEKNDQKQEAAAKDEVEGEKKDVDAEEDIKAKA